jgi:hypothetical protein
LIRSHPKPAPTLGHAWAVWRWLNFSSDEIACRGTGKLLVQRLAMRRLQGDAGRARYGRDPDDPRDEFASRMHQLRAAHGRADSISPGLLMALLTGSAVSSS